jgi:transcription initiation factor TFIID TATA-box-binding protein
VGKRPFVEIENIVASASVSQKIDLNSVVKAFPEVDYRPHVFPGLVFRLKRPKTAILIFETGRMVCTGAKSEKEAKLAVKRVVEKLRGHGIPVKNEPVVEIQNIVAYANLNEEVDLERLVYKLRKTIYEPEQFPGAVYRMDDPKVVFLIFSTGKLVCVGAKKEKEVYKAVVKLRRILKESNLMVHRE